VDNQGSVQSKLVGGVFSFIFQGSGIFLRKQKEKKATKNKKTLPWLGSDLQSDIL